MEQAITTNGDAAGTNAAATHDGGHSTTPTSPTAATMTKNSNSNAQHQDQVIRQRFQIRPMTYMTVAAVLSMLIGSMMRTGGYLSAQYLPTTATTTATQTMTTGKRRDMSVIAGVNSSSSRSVQQQAQQPQHNNNRMVDHDLRPQEQPPSPPPPPQQQPSQQDDELYHHDGVWKLYDLSFWRGKSRSDRGALCEDILPNISASSRAAAATTSTSPSSRMVMNITFSCDELFHKTPLGTGNWISAIYQIRMQLLANNLDVSMTCPDASAEQANLIIPWLMGTFPSRISAASSSTPAAKASTESRSLLPDEFIRPTHDEACKIYLDSNLQKMIPYARHELRRMAIAAVGVPRANPHHPAAVFAQQYMTLDHSDRHAFLGNTMQVATPSQPLFPNIIDDLDAVALHFRCGDIINSNHPSFGFVKFAAFANRVPVNTTSIGILTQPLNASSSLDQNTSQARPQDTKEANIRYCRTMLELFVAYLKERFPQARIRVHNDPTETIVVAYARMILADVVVSPISSFSVFPALASFGQSYIRKPDYRKAPNRFLNRGLPYDNIHLMDDAPALLCPHVRSMRKLPGGQDRVLEWLQNDTITREQIHHRYSKDKE